MLRVLNTSKSGPHSKNKPFYQSSDWKCLAVAFALSFAANNCFVTMAASADPGVVKHGGVGHTAHKDYSARLSKI